MTVLIAAKCRGGVLCATDSAITAGSSCYITPEIKGELWPDGSFVMFAGALYWAQDVFAAKDSKTFPEALRDVYEVHSEQSAREDDGAEFIRVDATGEIVVWESNGGYLKCGDYMAAGSGGDIARALLKRSYKPKQTLSWLTQELSEVIDVVAEENVTVRGPARFQFVKKEAKK